MRIARSADSHHAMNSGAIGSARPSRRPRVSSVTPSSSAARSMSPTRVHALLLLRVRQVLRRQAIVVAHEQHARRRMLEQKGFRFEPSVRERARSGRQGGCGRTALRDDRVEARARVVHGLAERRRRQLDAGRDVAEQLARSNELAVLGAEHEESRLADRGRLRARSARPASTARSSAAGAVGGIASSGMSECRACAALAVPMVAPLCGRFAFWRPESPALDLQTVSHVSTATLIPLRNTRSIY